MKILDVPQSGSLAGVTSSRNRFGQYKRTRAIPVNTDTLRQVTVRGYLSDLAQAWKTLTTPQMLAWESYAQSHPRTDSLGQSIVLTGLQAFIGVNSNILAQGSAVLADPPSDPTWNGDLVNSVSSTAGSMEVDHTVIATGSRLYIYVSPPKSPGVSFNADYRYLMAIGAGIAGVSDISGPYAARFGLPADGQKVFIRTREEITGVLGPEYDRVLVFTA